MIKERVIIISFNEDDTEFRLTIQSGEGLRRSYNIALGTIRADRFLKVFRSLEKTLLYEGAGNTYLIGAR